MKSRRTDISPKNGTKPLSPTRPDVVRTQLEAELNTYPVPSAPIEECKMEADGTRFALWAPKAENVRVNIYLPNDSVQSFAMKPQADGTWTYKSAQRLKDCGYTFQTQYAGKWQAETPGIFAKAVGVNGRRAYVVDMAETNPDGWENDNAPKLKRYSDVILYEMHHRDFSVDKQSGILHKGKFLALTETGTTTAEGLSTGIDHLKELGVTHVHLLPSFDFASVDEERPDVPQYNWGYDPQNYNVPEGSYATNAAGPKVRIHEFKQMVMALHKAGLRVVLDVVYNHTFHAENSNFQLTAPHYFYRHKADGTLANASGCNNETASERPMMRKFMLESVRYWIREYHIDGFRFDLMGIHDMATMNAIRAAVDTIDPSILIYGEGWAAEPPQLSENELAMKANTRQMPRIAAFGDEMRDALRGNGQHDEQGAFLIGEKGHEESLKFGVVGAIRHPQIDYKKVNYSKMPWASEPTQMISYVSCHDDLCLADRLKATLPHSSADERERLAKLVETVVLTSQGIPFLFAGDEMMRDKHGVRNSFRSADSINAIPWANKATHKSLFHYLCNMIQIRKAHAAFHLPARNVRKCLTFLPVQSGNLIAYELKTPTETLVVAFNSNTAGKKISIAKGTYKILCKDGEANPNGLGVCTGGSVTVPRQSALILHKTNA